MAEKAIDDFYVNRKAPDGHGYNCKDCEKILSLQRSRNPITKEKARLRAKLRMPTERKRMDDRWRGMIARCHDKNHISFSSYGARGISVCEQWRHSIRSFLEDMGPCPDGFSLERIDNNGNYCPENCKWASSHEQSNNRRTSRVISFEGKTMSMADWAREIGISTAILHYRITKMLLPIEVALTIPVSRSNSGMSRKLKLIGQLRSIK